MSPHRPLLSLLHGAGRVSTSADEVKDPARLALIRRLDLAGHLRDPGLDAIVSTVAAGCRVSGVMVNIVTPNLQTYLAESGVGVPLSSLPDDEAFCAEVVRTGRLLTVPDARAHPVYATTALVLDGTVGSYAGHPLRVGGRVVGVLAMFDGEPRAFTADELGILQVQAGLAEAVLQQRAAISCDLLTGLSTRALLLHRVAVCLRASAKSDRPVALLLLELADLAGINERHGSDAGDVVLRCLADRVAAACGAGDVVARVGGRTLAVLWAGVDSVSDARARSATVAAAAAQPLELLGARLEVDVRHGLATATSGTADALFASAARLAGVPPEAVGGQTVPADGLVDDLRAAIAQDQLVLHYHPVIDLASGRMSGVEALVRWQHPDGRLIPPLSFIPLAEQSGLIVDLGDWVLRTAGLQAARWAAAGRELDVAINLSPLQVSRPGFAEHVLDTLHDVGAPLDHVVLEVTESALLDDSTSTDSLRTLRGEGVRLALDDFGTGYASFSYFRRFPIDILKIDRSFVAGMGQHLDDDAIVGSIVSLARRTGKTVVAEGVETRAQADALRALGVPLAQGYLWTAPLPCEQVLSWSGATESGRLGELIRQMHAEGASLHTIAAALNGTGSRSPQGARWHIRSIAKILVDTRGARALA